MNYLKNKEGKNHKTFEDVMKKLTESPSMQKYLKSEEYQINQQKLERTWELYGKDSLTEEDIKELEELETSTGISLRQLD